MRSRRSTAGVDAATYTPFAAPLAQGTIEWLPDCADQVDNGTYPPDDATLTTHAGGLAHLVAESERLGVNAEMPRLFQSLVDRAVAEGGAAKSYPALVEQFARTAGTA
ncbi:hypothetical protein GCM10009676_34970 [Prauserella halophila]|uniref:NADPH-dependent reductive aminase-like C-terminal domain-containing protein n=1 Tax=Prauserella halophila TaxID=185641 RepID=A0ABN1WCQ1_9PSEU|nr:hypothetical protein [Prauserella halophila]MCP2238391.1 hypothetical protein [Prauserella halophila]